MSTDELVSCPGLLALELAPGSEPARTALERDEAEQLASCMAEDLRALLPDVTQAKLAVAGAHFDSAELLRPGFPVWATLTGLAERLHGDVVAFGTRDGRMPAAPLVPDDALAGGALRVLPWTLLADATLAERLGSAMEVELVGRGEAGPRTADFLMRTLGMRLEHLRYFSRHDLMALVCVHYEHVNLAPLWMLIESALLGSGQTVTTLSAHGLAWRHADGHAIAQSPGAWLRTTTTPMAERAHALAGIVFELRQYVALLTAHRVPLDFDAAHFDADGQFVVDHLVDPDPALPPAQLQAHEAPGLGVIALGVAQPGRMLAHAWMLGRSIRAACQTLAEHFNCDAEPARLGRIELDGAGQLAPPAINVH
ncbi:MAG TPA: hypothetical protein VF269_03380 [Rhodanobacteraceae bacterium]